MTHGKAAIGVIANIHCRGRIVIRRQLKKIIPRSFFTLTSKIELYRIRAQSWGSCPLADVNRINSCGLFASPTFQDELMEIKKEVSNLDIPDGSGGVNEGDRHAIYCLVRSLAPKCVLEIGTHIGMSTLYIALALKKLRAITRSACYSLTSVDIRDVNDPVSMPWRKYGSKRSPLEMQKQTECEDVVDFITMNSLDFLKNCTQHYDFIFLDGSHSSATVYQDIPAALKVLGSGSYILLHDYFPDLQPLWSNGAVVPGPYLAIERLRKEGVPMKVLPLGQLPWPTKLGSNITSLALLGR